MKRARRMIWVALLSMVACMGGCAFDSQSTRRVMYGPELDFNTPQGHWAPGYFGDDGRWVPSRNL